MDYNEIAENILENYTNTYCQADVERVAKVLKEISRQTAEEFYEFAKAWFEDDEQNDYFEEVKNLSKQYGVEIKDNEN